MSARGSIQEAESEIPLMISLGISGHRNLGNSEKVERVRALVAAQFECLCERLAQYGQPIQFLLISPLAEGADRVFVEAVWAVAPQAHLLVPLPFAKEAYERSFSDEASVARFNELLRHPNCIEWLELPRGIPGEYFEVGKYIIDHSDVVFFLHDGSDINEVGLDGGTSSVIRYAEHRGRCLIADEGTGAGQGRRLREALYGLPGPHEQLVAVYINITSLAARVVTSYCSGRPVEYADMDGFFEEVWHGPSGALARPTLVSDLDGLSDALQSLSRSRFSAPVRRYRRLLLPGWVVFAILAWSASCIAVVAPTHIWPVMEGAAEALHGWAQAGLGLLASIGGLWLVYERSGVELRIAELDYLAERVKYLEPLLRAGMSISRLLALGRDDPAGRALNKRWQSIYYDCYLRSRELLQTPAEAARLKELLTSPTGWLRRHLEERLARMLRIRRLGARLMLLARLTFTATVAGFLALTLQGLLGADSDGQLLVAVPLGLGLALAALGSYGFGRILAAKAAADERACRRLAELEAAALFTVLQDPDRELERLRTLVEDSVEAIMQRHCAGPSRMRPRGDSR
jgi:hypothetical protein